jgi:hypothetical protein
MVTPEFRGPGHMAELRGGEDKLPSPFAGGIRVFAGDGFRHRCAGVVPEKIFIVLDLHFSELKTERIDERARKECGPVLIALTVSDKNMSVVEIYVLDAKVDAFIESHAGAVEEAGHHVSCPGHSGEDVLGFSAGEDDREAFGAVCPLDVPDVAEFDREDVFIEEDKCVERLVLRRRRDMFVADDVGKEGADFRFSHGGRVT